MEQKIEEMKDKVPAFPSSEEWQKISQSFARAVMRGAIGAVLKLDDEARNIVLREIGAAACESFLQTEGKKWQTDGLPQVAKAVMSGAFKGILKLDEQAKRLVLMATGTACFQRHLESYRSWEAAGIPLTPGSYDVDSTVTLLEKQMPFREVKREGDTIFWKGKELRARYGGCTCCLVQSGITEPVPELCQCGTWCQKIQFEYYTGIPMEAELVETLNTGSQNDCEFRIHIRPTLYTTQNPVS